QVNYHIVPIETMPLTKAFYMQAPLKSRWASQQDLWLQAGVASCYFLSAKLGLLLVPNHSLASPIWPPAGISLAAMLLLGYRIWPGLIAGSFFVNMSVLVGSGRNPLLMMLPAVSGACGNTLETLAAAWLARTFARGRDAFRQPQTVLLFIAFAAVASTAIGAGIGALAEVWAGLTKWREAGARWFSWWLGDMVSVLVFTPL